MTPIKIFNPVYSGQQGHASIETEDQIKNAIVVNPGHEGGARKSDQVYSQKLVQGAGYLLPGRMMHYGGSQQTGQDRPRGPVASQFPSWGQIPPGIRLGGGHQVGQPEQWYRNSSSDLPDPAKIKKEIEAMMASFGLKAFDDSPFIRVPPTLPISATQVSSNQQASSFYQEYSGPPQPKRARPNVKKEASPTPKEQNDPSQLNSNSSVPHLVVSPPPQRGVGNIPLRQISSSYDPSRPNPPHRYDATSHNPQEPSQQQVYIHPPSHEYVSQSPQEYANPLSHEYVGQSPQEYENPLSHEYVGQSPQEYENPLSHEQYVGHSPQEYENTLSQEYIGHSPQDPSEEYVSQSPQDPSQEYVSRSPQDPSEEYVSQSPQDPTEEYVSHSPLEPSEAYFVENPTPFEIKNQEIQTPQDPSQEYSRQSPQEYVNPLSQEYQVSSPNVGHCEESSLKIMSTVCRSKSPVDPSITPITTEPSIIPTTTEPSITPTTNPTPSPSMTTS